MKLVYFIDNETGSSGWGVLESNDVVDLDVQHFDDLFKKKQVSSKKICINKITITSPIPKPTSLRDAYAFRQHVEAGRKSLSLIHI